MSLNAIVQRAISIRKAEIKRGRPMNEKQGFKEAHIALAMSFAFRDAGYIVFPEFPCKKGSIDAVVMNDDEVLICEWKQVYQHSAQTIVEQTKRMLRFDPPRDFPKYGIKVRPREIKRFWVCDTWNKTAVNWWVGRTKKIRPPSPFVSGWFCGYEEFASFGDGWDPYFWLWAYTVS
jgi:hypothetical protein